MGNQEDSKIKGISDETASSNEKTNKKSMTKKVNQDEKKDVTDNKDKDEEFICRADLSLLVLAECQLIAHNLFQSFNEEYAKFGSQLIPLMIDALAIQVPTIILTQLKYPGLSIKSLKLDD